MLAHVFPPLLSEAHPDIALELQRPYCTHRCLCNIVPAALLEERALTVAELAKRFEMGLLSGDGTDEDDSGKLQGRHLIMDLLEHTKVRP